MPHFYNSCTTLKTKSNNTASVINSGRNTWHTLLQPEDKYSTLSLKSQDEQQQSTWNVLLRLVKCSWFLSVDFPLGENPWVRPWLSGCYSVGSRGPIYRPGKGFQRDLLSVCTKLNGCMSETDRHVARILAPFWSLDSTILWSTQFTFCVI